jgi:hypothetical protein
MPEYNRNMTMAQLFFRICGEVMAVITYIFLIILIFKGVCPKYMMWTMICLGSITCFGTLGIIAWEEYHDS